MPEPPLFGQLQKLATERRNTRSMAIDVASVEDILEIINTEDHKVPIAVREEMPFIAEAVRLVVGAFRKDGRLIYAGAGTSGRLGIIDASECPPTFGTPPDMVQGVIAGGPEAVFRAQEGAEDLEENGAAALQALDLRAEDVVCGIAASSRTPFVVGAIAYAREIGCRTIFLTSNPRGEFDVDADVAICPAVGPEVVMGSTRMKSGTAQKLVLNMITTAAMIRLGKVYENMMIDLQMTNEKLVERSKRIVMTVTGVSYERAGELLDQSKGHVKTALVMELGGVDFEEARARLAKANGFVRPAISGDSFSALEQ